MSCPAAWTKRSSGALRTQEAFQALNPGSTVPEVRKDTTRKCSRRPALASAGGGGGHRRPPGKAVETVPARFRTPSGGLPRRAVSGTETAPRIHVSVGRGEGRSDCAPPTGWPNGPAFPPRDAPTCAACRWRSETGRGVSTASHRGLRIRTKYFRPPGTAGVPPALSPQPLINYSHPFQEGTVLSDETFDVFFSYNSKDRDLVRQVRDALKKRGVRVWMDEEVLPYGRTWQPKVEATLQKVDAAAILLGPSGFGDWQTQEAQLCQTQGVKRGIPVIPVLLPGGMGPEDLPSLLAERTCCDLREGLAVDKLDRLAREIQGTAGAAFSTPSGIKIQAPRLHNLPFSTLGDLLKGRDEEIARLQASLQSSGNPTAITQAQTIHGLGGIGKTRLAVEYAWRSGDRYDLALFVVADSPEALRLGLASLARPGLLALPEYEASAEAKALEAVLRWLQDHDRWLLILDNVDSKEAVQEVAKILPLLSRGHVLITSRVREWPPGIKRQPLETLTPDEAQRFLIDRTQEDRSPTDDDPAQALALAEELGGLPLALEQAGAYIAHHQMTLAGYLESWRAERDKVLVWHDATIMQYPASVAATWQKTFERLSPTAAAILRLAAFLAPEPIAQEMFEKGEEFVREAVKMFCKETRRKAGKESIKDGIAELATYSMINRKGDMFTVHRMVQQVMRTRIPAERRKEWVERSLRVVNRFAPFEASDVRTWPVWDRLRPHAVEVVQLADILEIAHPTVRLMSQLAVLLHAKSLYTEAESLVRRALDIDESAVNLNNLAQVLAATNRLAEAEPLMRRALDIDEQAFGNQHPNVARDLNNLATLLQDTNRLAEAEPLMRRALDINEQAFGNQHPNVAIDVNNLATLLQDTNRLAEAEPLMRRALDIDEQAFGNQHPNVARDLNNLALLLKATNRLAEAEPLMKRAVEIWEASLGDDHPTTQLGQRNLALLLAEIKEQSDPGSGPFEETGPDD
ncbi:MAG TPA: tetratricopeptide repeat protein [Thermoanaerobaculia bacterium]